ncbi:hypothetical protein F5Y16DRAFT_402837 [Xylariaceae sp. FL0255]|nr:hypothetical protein F5Y16DRAFT_402837 [Xylariaceae sp. FL0255]
MKALQISIGFLPTLSLAGILTRDLVTPAPCVGIAIKNIIGPDGIGELENQGFGVVGIDGSDLEYKAANFNTLYISLAVITHKVGTTHPQKKAHKPIGSMWALWVVGFNP